MRGKVTKCLELFGTLLFFLYTPPIYIYEYTHIYMDMHIPIHSGFHRILEWFSLACIPKDPLVQLPAKGSDIFLEIKLLKDLSNLSLSHPQHF